MALNNKLLTKKYILCVLTFVIGCLSNSLSSQNLSYKNFDVDDGLSSSIIYTAFQDSKGFMWFASDLGVCRYDGYKFTRYSMKDGLSDNEVFNFFEDSSNRIWFQTFNGKISYYKDDEIINSTKDTTLTRLNSESFVSGMIEDANGTIWISTFRNGIINYTKNKTVHRFFNDDMFESINRIMPLASNKILVIARYGLYQVEFNKKNDTVVKIEELHFTLDKILHLSRSIQLSTREILFSDRGTVYYGNITIDKFAVFLKQKMDSVVVNNLSKDDENVWICTNYGATPYSIVSKKFLSPVLKSYKVSSVLKDIEGNYWFTTLGDGVFFCSSNAMYSYTMSDGLVSNKITCLAKDSHNKIWFGYEKGIIGSFHHNQIHTTSICNKTTSNNCRIHKIHFAGTKCWVAASLGLFLLEDNQTEVLYSNFRDIIEYPKDHIWGAASNYIFSMDRNTFDKFKNKTDIHLTNYKVGWTTDITKKKSERSRSFFLDSKSNIWISTEKYLYVTRKDSLVRVNPEKFNDQLLINDFDELLDKALIMATDGNGVLFQKKDGQIITVTENQGLSSNICNAVAVDNDGVVWVGTNKGLNKITGYPDNITVEYFNCYDGMLSDEIGDVLVLNDTVWTATKKGINFFNKNHIKRKLIHPKIYIDNITVRGIPIKINQQDKNLVFEHDENDIGIKYVSPLYGSIGKIVYRYKLHKESQWKYTKDPFLYFSELSWGNYEFKVAARGRSKIWSEEASLSFTIKKPFWRTNFFLGILIILFGLFIWIGASVYFGQQKTKVLWQQRIVISELKTLRAQMNPHFLFNALNSIQELFLKNDHNAAQDYLSKFGKLMRSILDHSEKISIEEEIASVTNYLEIEQLRTNYQFNYRIEIDSSIDIYTTEMPAMILQPFIENAIWHGFANRNEIGELLIAITMNYEKAITIVIKDNGVGRIKSRASRKRDHKSKGIQLIKERVDILNFENKQKIELEIEDLEDEQGNHPGTQVKIKIPSIYE